MSHKLPMSSVDVADVVRVELLGRERERHGSVVGERADGRMRCGEMASQSSEPDRVQEPIERDALAVELGSDGPVCASRSVRRIGRPEVGFEQGV